MVDRIRGRQVASGQFGLLLHTREFLRSGHPADKGTVAGVTGNFVCGRAWATTTEKIFPEPG